MSHLCVYAVGVWDLQTLIVMKHSQVSQMDSSYVYIWKSIKDMKVKHKGYKQNTVPKVYIYKLYILEINW